MTTDLSTAGMSEAMRLAMLRADPARQPLRSAAAHHLPSTISTAAIAAGRSWSATTRTTSTRCCRAMRSTRSAMLSTLGHWDAGSHGAMGHLRAEDRDAGEARRAERRHQAPDLPQARADPLRVLFHLQAGGDRAEAVGDRRALVRLALRPAGRRPRRRRRARHAAPALPQRSRRQAPAEMAVQARDDDIQGDRQRGQDASATITWRRTAGRTCRMASSGSATTRSRPR